MKFLHPYVMLFLAPLFWATSNVTGKLGKAWLSPYAFTFWRWLLATALLSLLFRRQIRADWPPLKARAGWLFVVGGSGFALFNVVLYGAFARGASVVNVSMITALIPLAVLLVDVGFLRGRVHPLQWLGVALSFVGVLWLVSRGEPLALTMNLLPVFGALVGVAVFADERLGGYVLVALALVAAGIGLSEWGAMRLAFRRGA